MTGFFTNWTKKKDYIDYTNKELKESLPLKPRIENVMNKTQLQISKLDAKIAKMKGREQEIFNKVIDAVKTRNTIYAKSLSNELLQMRKSQRTLNQARMALEQVSMRISTIHDLGEIMEILEPAMSPVKGLKSDFERLVPSTDMELNYMQMLTDSILSDSMQNNEIDVIDMNIVGSSKNKDTDHIMNEASAVLEEHNNSIKDFS
jgi:division protein CdvB (Snf7/Vps24/ESCRT-III family)